MRATLNILFTIVLIGQHSLAVEVYFTPSADCEQQITSAIDNASDIAVAVYSINNVKIVNALKRAHARKAKLRILTDRLQAAGPSSKVIELKSAGINVKVHSKHKIMHNKFLLADDKIAISGSYNFTEPASKSNDENCIVMKEPNAIAAYKNQFEKLWELNTKESSEKKLRDIAAKQKK